MILTHVVELLLTSHLALSIDVVPFPLVAKSSLIKILFPPTFSIFPMHNDLSTNEASDEILVSNITNFSVSYFVLFNIIESVISSQINMPSLKDHYKSLLKLDTVQVQ